MSGDSQIRECCNFIGAYGGIDGGLDRDGSRERKHKGGWIGEVVDKKKLIL